MNPQLVRCCALLVLGLQLSTIHHSVPIPPFAVGSIATSTPTHAETPPSRRVPVQYVAEERSVRDSVIFVGDILLARNIEVLMQRHGATYPTDGLQFTDIATDPFVVGNFEAAVPERHSPTPSQQLQFSVAERYLPALAAAGVTHVSLANNHALDFGPTGFQHTRQTLRAHELTPFGTPMGSSTQSAVTYLDTEAGRIAVIGIHTLTQLPSVTYLQTVFAEATARSDFQVAYVHWGTEYRTTHSVRQADIARRLVDAGADLIVGHHPHVVQDIQRIEGVVVVYSLGNYIFDQYQSSDTQTGLLAHLSLAEQRLHLLPVESSTAPSQPRWQQPERHAQFLHDLANRSEPALQEAIVSGHIPLHPEVVASSTKLTMMGR